MSGKCRAGVSSALRVIEAKAIARPGQQPSYRCAANQRNELAALHIQPSSGDGIVTAQTRSWIGANPHPAHFH
jgi:hypothetical protein